MKKNVGPDGKRAYYVPPDIIVPSHPLDPLTPDEVLLAVKICKQLRPGCVFASVALHEPDKETVLKFRPGDDIDRKVFTVLHDHSQDQTFEMILNIAIEHNDEAPSSSSKPAPLRPPRPQTLSEREEQVTNYSVVGNELASLKHIPDVQPRIMPHEYYAVEKLLLENTDFLRALEKRGITDATLVKADPWSVGYFTEEDHPSRRLTRPLLFLKRTEKSNEYNCPIEGLSPLIDLNRMEVIRVDDYRSPPVPEDATDWKEAWKTSPLPQLKPYKILQPEGPSFRLDGYHLMWDKWDMRLGFSPREGVILHLISFFDATKSELRPVIYRASLSEMVVPYGNPLPPHYRKNAFDIGEDGIGANLNSLKGNCDCIGAAAFIDVHMADSDGDCVTIPRAICVHEEDYGVLWKHTDFRTEKSSLRRGRRLVVSSFTTVANYDYGFNWHFYQDGTIEFENVLTGILSAQVLSGIGSAKYGTPVGSNIIATNHQHFLAVRLNMMVDGVHNSIHEVNSETSHPSDINMMKNAFVATTHQIKTEKDSGRICNQASARHWLVTNPSKHNKWGSEVGYVLEPGANVLPFAHPDAPIMKRAPFLAKHVWATQYHPDMKYIAGDYPNQAPKEKGGITEWIDGDRSLDNEDVVLWYTFGVAHFPRPEVSYLK
eukprot:TRINITY_DN1119_c0_g1_i1.p1 TRINITY_DN1119_c0_g1~~TRINITY_DN1119_c0_g1_i1.p1  ORF type:complete len:657 (-),score=110.91 TRINITY_DN1119_c0_g1_i1:167-2137(-)